MATRFRNRNYRPYGLVHITARGYNKRQILFGETDRAELMTLLRRQLHACAPRDRPKLLACALINNHVHFLFQHGEDPTVVARIMHSIEISFARRFNERNGTSGPVWESPFRGRVVRGGDDLINVVTYIHLNPDSSTRDGNSSHPVYMGNRPPGIISTELVLKTFGGREAYAEFFKNTTRIRAARAAATHRINQ